MKIDLYTATGEKKGTIEVPAAMFEAKINPDLMHRAVLMRLSNARRPIAHTLTRGEVAYSTRKLFRQKGTGRARRGARSTNLLRGGGVAHGPRNTRNFTKMMPKKERRAALFSALTAQGKAGKIFALESHNWKEPKTKVFVELLKKLPSGRRYLFVLGQKDTIFEKSSRNVPAVKTILASYLNPYDLLLAEQICFVGDALEVAKQTFLPANK